MKPEHLIAGGAIGIIVAIGLYEAKRSAAPAAPSPCVDTFHHNPWGEVECDRRARLELLTEPFSGVLCRCERDGGAP